MRDAAVERLARWAVREAYDRVHADCPAGKLPTVHSIGEYLAEHGSVLDELQEAVLQAVNRVLDAGKKK